MKDKDKDKGDLEEFKAKYEVLKKKHGLPSFSELTEDFNIERASEAETEYPLREIRKFISDKLFNYLRFVEALLNPSNVPMYVFSIVKTLGADEKKKLSDIYAELAKIEIMIMEIDLDYSEKAEADFIKSSFKAWQTMKKDLLKIAEVVKKNWDLKSEAEKKGYFG